MFSWTGITPFHNEYIRTQGHIQNVHRQKNPNMWLPFPAKGANRQTDIVIYLPKCVGANPVKTCKHSLRLLFLLDF